MKRKKIKTVNNIVIFIQMYTQSIQTNIEVYKSILQYRNKYFNIEIKDVITKYHVTLIAKRLS